jgi:hypothetical protein
MIGVGDAPEARASGVSQSTGGPVKLTNGQIVTGANSPTADWTLNLLPGWIGQDANGQHHLPEIFVSQGRGQINIGENSDAWGQASGRGSGAFSTSTTQLSATSSVTIATTTGNACNSVNNTTVGTSQPIDSGSLGWFMKGFAAGTYEIVFMVDTTISVTGSLASAPVSGNVS